MVYTIHLRRDAVWSDGEPLVAQHYVDGIIRLLKPDTAAEYAWLMYIIQGSEAFNYGETNDPTTVGIRAVDDYTLEIALESPASYFDSILAFFTTYPVREDIIERYGNQWTEAGNFVGNGPYRMAEWAHNDYLTVEKNSLYHSRNDVTIERIEFPIIVDDATALVVYERGELDISGYPPEELSRIIETMPDHFVRLPRPGSYYLGLNTLHSPTDNVNMRKALSSSINRRDILDNVLEQPWRIAACGVIPPEIPGYQGCRHVGYDFDIGSARGYLAAAKMEMGVDDESEITVNLWYNQGNEDVMEAVAEQWENNLGINVNTTVMEWGGYLDTLDQCND